MTRAWIALGALLVLGGCAGSPEPRVAQPQAELPAPGTKPQDALAGTPPAAPEIRRAERPLQCVPYARQVSGIRLRGDAWTWWRQAHGAYARGHTPQPGAVIVLDTGQKRGHLAVVERIAGPRRIVVDHANWLNRGRIHENTPMVDVSPGNDWSRVRVWYTPGGQLGASRYDVVGFIYPERIAAER